MSAWFDQSVSTCSIDITFCQLCVLKNLDSKWIKWINPNSLDYDENKGIGRVTFFPNVVAIGDGTLVK